MRHAYVSSSTGRPASRGAISNTSRSPVSRENPYTTVTTNPPIQSSLISSLTAESNSRKNESHGSGILLFGYISKLFSLHVGQEIPVRRDWRTMFPQPCSLSLDHGVLAEVSSRASRAPSKGPKIVGVVSLAPGRPCPPPRLSPERQRIPIGFADHVPWRCEPANPSPSQGRSKPTSATPQQLGHHGFRSFSASSKTSAGFRRLFARR
jgi:hypothetical protein